MMKNSLRITTDSSCSLWPLGQTVTDESCIDSLALTKHSSAKVRVSLVFLILLVATFTGSAFAYQLSESELRANIISQVKKDLGLDENHSRLEPVMPRPGDSTGSDVTHQPSQKVLIPVAFMAFSFMGSLQRSSFI